MAKQKDKRNIEIIKYVLLAVGCIILSLLVLFVFIPALENMPVSTNTNQKQGTVITKDGKKDIYKNDFELIKEETTGTREKDGTYKIKGKVKQNIEGSYTSIVVTMTLLDKNGNKIRNTTGLQSSNYLGDNIWEFVVYGNDADGVVTDFKLDNCYGY